MKLRNGRAVGKVSYKDSDRERRCAEKRATHEERSDFERDRSRVIHSAAFRRLQGKTQVFTVGEGDFFRSRLTHSLEVAQIGKGLALRLGADPDLVETVSLIHDIGHPPFGHAGEDELKRLMMPYGGFEANAQNIRVLTKLETKSKEYQGLNLTRAVIDGQMKYKEAFCKEKVKSGKQKKFIYKENLELVDWASSDARSAIEGGDREWKSFECEIMDWADEVAYAVHDLEDSIHARYIAASSFQEDARINSLVREVKKKFKDRDVDTSKVWNSLLNDHLLKKNPDFQFGNRSSEKEKKYNRKSLTSYLINRYIKATVRVQRGTVLRDNASERYLYRVDIPDEFEVEVALINKLIWKFVIQSPQVRTLEEKGRYVIRCLFLKFMHKDNAKYLLPNDWKEYLPNDNSVEDTARVVSDYISGMTDGYAQKTYARLYLPNQGTIYDLL